MVRPALTSPKTNAQKVATELGQGNFVATTLQKHYARKNITKSELTDIKEAMIDISDENKKQRSLAQIGTLKRAVRKTIKTQEGGTRLPVTREEASDAMFVDFVLMVTKLQLQIPDYFWIIFRFVFMQIPLDVYLQIYDDYHTSSTTMQSISQTTAKSHVHPSKEDEPSRTVRREVSYSDSRIHPNRSRMTPRILTSTPRFPSNRMIGKGADV